ncbi:hypothetical protein [Oceanobacillus halophilus]|uniref:Carbon monoxide dehydrogenase n=1 Tax=Oceanobacillus halophilus TaxID=930130 RepID=A0A495A6N9_9BACI|nr:hypothetical protein [Oceanobacillus halophilus]RKQ33981.1 hypothetical protein D8M06_09170 [Oceanobacillus halophilus]
MNKYIFLLLFFLISILIGNGAVFASKEDRPKPAEEFYEEFGYEPVEEAIKKAEQHFDQKLPLPTRLPALTFTHYFGRFDRLAGDINASFELKFIHEQVPENHYKIDVRPAENRIPVRDKDIIDVFKLKNGKDATYLKISGFHVLVFEQSNWQYILSVDKRVSDKVPAVDLVKIANSIHAFKKDDGGK